jgi:acyl carrier protein
MTRDELITTLSDWIAEITEEPALMLTPETDLVQDLGLDSLALAELTAKLRLRLKIKLRPGELRHDLRVGSLVELVLARLPA